KKLIMLAIATVVALPAMALAQEAPCPDDRTPAPYVPKNTGSKEIFHKPVKSTKKAAAKKAPAKKSTKKSSKKAADKN
ncbi:hypothetical protein ABTH32_20295, partial [Acinetobacter baumannii]